MTKTELLGILRYMPDDAHIFIGNGDFVVDAEVVQVYDGGHDCYLEHPIPRWFDGEVSWHGKKLVYPEGSKIRLMTWSKWEVLASEPDFPIDYTQLHDSITRAELWRKDEIMRQSRREFNALNHFIRKPKASVSEFPVELL